MEGIVLTVRGVQVLKASSFEKKGVRGKFHCPEEKGYFENLSSFIALGFAIGDGVVTERSTKKIEGESVFYFSEEDMPRIDHLNKRGQNTWEEKCEDVIAYVIELVFELAVSVLDNVGDDQGIESCHGSW